MREKEEFTSYQKLVILGLGSLLFTVVLDYMLLPALSSTLLDKLNLSTEEFGLVASAYAVSAGISAILASGFADRFDRKSFLIVFYSGFLMGIIFCALSPSFPMLLGARIITGAFGGMIASISYALVADLFTLEQRGQVMGWIQMAFAASLVIGLPLSLFLASSFSWQFSYGLIFGLGSLALLLVSFIIRPSKKHSTRLSSPWAHLFQSLRKSSYWTVFGANILIVGGDVIFMTFNAAYLTYNLGIEESELPWVYGAIGLTTLISAPVFGRISDRIGKWVVFSTGTLIAILAVLVYTWSNTASFEWIILLHVILYLGINARMVSLSALATAIPAASNRGAFMAIDSSIQQLAGGLAAAVAGWVIFQDADGRLLHYPQIGSLIAVLMVLSSVLVLLVNIIVNTKSTSEEN